MRYTTSALEWKTIADTLKDILTECFFVFDQQTITMNNVDPEKVVEVYLEITPNSSYNCPTKFVFPIYIQTVYRVLRGVKANDTMTMEDDPQGNLVIHVYSHANVLKNQVILKSLHQNVPSFIRNARTYAVAVKFESDQLYHILHDLSALSRKVSISIKDKVVTFQSEDESGTISCYKNQFEELVHVKFHNTYLVKFLEKFTKPCLTDMIVVRIENSVPLSVVYPLANGFLEMTIAGLE